MSLLLHALSPEAIACDVAAVLRARGVEDGGLAPEIARIVRWAQRGPEAETVEAGHALEHVVRRLFLPPTSGRGDPLAARIGHPAEPPLAALAVAVMGARGRLRLARVELVEPRELAALVGVDESWVRSLIRSQRLVRDPKSASPRAPLTAASAQPFLAKAGVPPWGASNGGMESGR